MSALNHPAPGCNAVTCAEHYRGVRILTDGHSYMAVCDGHHIGRPTIAELRALIDEKLGKNK